jgi:hypothetical protein
MTDMRGLKPSDDVETGSSRSKMIGAAVVVLGLGALGAYAFASQSSPTPGSGMQMASNQVHTTPAGMQQQMPPPVAPLKAQPTPLDNTPLMPKNAGTPKASGSSADNTSDTGKSDSKNDTSHQATNKAKAPVASAPAMTPPENQPAAQPTQPATTPEQPQPQETPAPTENTVPPQGQ